MGVFVAGKTHPEPVPKDYVWPCGCCRQNIEELRQPNGDVGVTSVRVRSATIEVRESSITQLLKDSFGPANLGGVEHASKSPTCRLRAAMEMSEINKMSIKHEA